MKEFQNRLLIISPPANLPNWTLLAKAPPGGSLFLWLRQSPGLPGFQWVCFPLASPTFNSLVLPSAVWYNQRRGGKLLDKTSKKILNYLISQGKGTDFICAFNSAWAGLSNTTIEALAKNLKIPTEDVRAAVRYLKEEGDLEYQYSSSPRGEKELAAFTFPTRGFTTNTFATRKSKSTLQKNGLISLPCSYRCAPWWSASFQS